VTLPAGEEPVAAVARSLSPSVVQIETASGVGAGFVYDSEGRILTAAHVVEGYGEVTVVLADGTRITGAVVGYDSGTDVGVVQVDAPGLVPAPLAVGILLEVGQTAIALGSPFGLDQTVTAGVISAIDRSVQAPDETSVRCCRPTRHQPGNLAAHSPIGRTGHRHQRFTRPSGGTTEWGSPSY
jgi:putative serine protease PepD